MSSTRSTHKIGLTSSPLAAPPTPGRASCRNRTLQSREAAQGWIDHLRAGGSTDINRALLEALAELDAGKSKEAARPAYVLFLTDGQPTVGETDAERIVTNAENNTPAEQSVRLFPFGIGYDVNTDLLDTLGSLLGGRSSYVQPDERIDEAVGSFYAQISTPVLAEYRARFWRACRCEGDLSLSAARPVCRRAAGGGRPL